ncbi:MAG: TolC family protein [Pseudomonadota bacterium]
MTKRFATIDRVRHGAGFLFYLALATAAGCQTIEAQYDKFDRHLIDRTTEAAEPIVKHYLAESAKLPDSEKVFAATTVDVVHRSDGRTLTITPAYTSDLIALDQLSRQHLRDFADNIRGNLSINLTVVGHASAAPLGPDARAQYNNNETLSRRRAQSVANFLQSSLDLPKESVTVQGEAAQNPIDPNPTHPRNRRVEVIAAWHTPTTAPSMPIPRDFDPWWRKPTTSTFGTDNEPFARESIESLYASALTNSSQIRVFTNIPLIRATAIDEARGRFDTRAFAEGQYANTNEPVGSTLTTGGATRFSERTTFAEGGLRRRLATGGELELSQRVGTQDNNSVFFIPEHQASARLRGRYTQPLLNGAGVDYNRAPVAIAKLDAEIADDEFKRQVESHLLEINRSYWTLYRERAALLQRQKLMHQAEQIVRDIEARRSVDTLKSQTARAHAELASRRSEVVRSELAVRNAQTRIRALVNDPRLSTDANFEIVPTMVPTARLTSISMRTAAEEAIRNRPEIAQVYKQIQAAAIRAEMSENELFPVFNLIFEARVDGLDSGFSIADAHGRQFDRGRPSVAVGFQFEMPLENRTARARHQRRRLEVRQLRDQLRTTIETILLEVQVAVREINTAHREAESEYASLLAATSELETLADRRSLSGRRNGWGGTRLDDEVTAQRRLAEAEQEFVTSLVVYNVALENINRATGTLLQSKDIHREEGVDEEGLPLIRLVERQP